jgi:hypothetical protein
MSHMGITRDLDPDRALVMIPILYKCSWRYLWTALAAGANAMADMRLQGETLLDHAAATAKTDVILHPVVSAVHASAAPQTNAAIIACYKATVWAQDWLSTLALHSIDDTASMTSLLTLLCPPYPLHLPVHPSCRPGSPSGQEGG